MCFPRLSFKNWKIGTLASKSIQTEQSKVLSPWNFRTTKFAVQVLPERIRTYNFTYFTYQVGVINFHKIRILDTNLVSKVQNWDMFENSEFIWNYQNYIEIHQIKISSHFFIYLHQICVQFGTLSLMRIDNPYLVGKMFKNISPDSVWSGKFGCPVLSSQETHMPSPVESYRLYSRI